MLVYHKEPMVRTKIAGYDIYGACYNYGRLGPTNIPIALYRENRDRLVEAPCTQNWLENKFGTSFPNIKFTRNSLRRYDWPTIRAIGIAVGVKCTWPPKRGPKDPRDIRAFIKAIYAKLDP